MREPPGADERSGPENLECVYDLIARLCNAADRTMPRLQDRVEIVNTLLGMTLKELQREDVDAHMQRSHGQREVLVRAVVAGNA